jgi:hypothetical protein
MKTAMQQHLEWLKARMIVTEQMEQVLLEQEEQHIIEAYVACWKANMPDGFECKLSAKEYYNQTFKRQIK